MQFYMLYEERFGPIPEDITTVHDFGRTQIIRDDRRPGAAGKSMVLEGPEDSFKKWLKPFDYFWVGQGNPIEERFRVVHIKDES